MVRSVAQRRVSNHGPRAQASRLRPPPSFETRGLRPRSSGRGRSEDFGRSNRNEHLLMVRSVAQRRVSNHGPRAQASRLRPFPSFETRGLRPRSSGRGRSEDFGRSNRNELLLMVRSVAQRRVSNHGPRAQASRLRPPPSFETRGLRPRSSGRGRSKDFGRSNRNEHLLMVRSVAQRRVSNHGPRAQASRLRPSPSFETRGLRPRSSGRGRSEDFGRSNRNELLLMVRSVAQRRVSNHGPRAQASRLRPRPSFETRGLRPRSSGRGRSEDFGRSNRNEHLLMVRSVAQRRVSNHGPRAQASRLRPFPSFETRGLRPRSSGRGRSEDFGRSNRNELL